MNNKKTYIRYLLTTIANTSVNIITSFLLLQLGFSVRFSNAVSIIVETPVSFLLKNKYVFKNAESPILVRFYKFVLSRLLSMIIEFFGVLLLCLFIDKYISKIIIQVIIFLINYILSDKYVFKNHI